MNKLYIPGLMPLGPQYPPPILADPLGGINAVIYKTTDTSPKTSFSLIAETIEGKALLVDDQGARMFFRSALSGGEYRFITDYKKDFFPVGTSVLRVMVDQAEEKKFYISVPSGAFKTLRDRPYVPPGVTLSGRQAISEGDNTVIVDFAPAFISPPMVVLVQVLADLAAVPPLSIDAHVLQLYGTRVVVELSQPANSGGYSLAWAAWF